MPASGVPFAYIGLVAKVEFPIIAMPLSGVPFAYVGLVVEVGVGHLCVEVPADTIKNTSDTCTQVLAVQHINSHALCMHTSTNLMIVTDASIDLQLINHVQIDSPCSPLLCDLHCFLLYHTRSPTPNTTTVDRMTALKTHAPTTNEATVARESSSKGSSPTAMEHSWNGIREEESEVSMLLLSLLHQSSTGPLHRHAWCNTHS